MPTVRDVSSDHQREDTTPAANEVAGADVSARTQVEQILRRSETRLALQYAVTTILATSATLDEAIPMLLETIGKHLNWDVGVYWTMDQHDTVLRCRALWRRPSLDLTGFTTLSQQITFAPGVGLPGRVWASRTPALIPDVVQDANFPRAALAAAEGLHGAVCFPVATGNALYSVMEFFSHDIGDLSADLVQVLTTLGTQIGQFIERTRAEEAVRASAESFRLLFASHPQPMWVYDLETLAFLEVNNAAVEQYGYTREEFLGMRITDIRPDADQERLLEDVRQPRPALQHAGQWRHRRKDGRLLDVGITSHTLEFAGRAAVLVAARDITEHKRAEAALRVSLARKGAILQTALDAIITMDHKGRIIEFNPAAEQTFGYSRREAVGRGLADLIIPPDLREQHRAGLARYLATGDGPVIGRRIEVTAMRADGSLFPAEVAITRVPLDGPPLFTGYLRDITERRQQEAALRANEERFRATFEQAAVGMAHVGLDGQWLRVNDKLCAIVGYTRAELSTCTFQDITYPDDLDADLEYVRRLLAGEIQTYAMEKRHIRKDGSLVWINLTVSLVRAPSSAPRYFISVVEDITEKKRLEQRTHEALDALLAMAEAIVLTSEEPGATDAGATAERLAELTRQVLGCKHVAIVALMPGTEELRPVAIAGFSREDSARWWRQWDRRPHLRDRLEAAHVARLYADDVLILDRTQPPFPRETSLGRHTVLMVPLRVSGALTGVLSVDHGAAAHEYTPDEIALIRAAGRLVALVIDRERLLQEGAEARARELALREANRRMEEFLSLAGHELRTPLTSVLGNVQLATQWLDEVQQQDRHEGAGGRDEPVPKRLAQVSTLLRRMERQGRVLARLVGDLLDSSRIQAGRLELHPESCDLTALVREIVREHQQRAPQRTVRLDVPDQEVPVIADAERIGQVLTNYLSNALKYAPPAQPITAGVAVAGLLARVWVRDEGPGLPPAEHGRVWERFYRVAGVEHQDGASVGLGLGLYISRTIVERHGGQVGVESSPGAGTAFWFTIPLARPGEGGRRDAWGE